MAGSVAERGGELSACFVEPEAALLGAALSSRSAARAGCDGSIQVTDAPVFLTPTRRTGASMKGEEEGHNNKRGEAHE